MTLVGLPKILETLYSNLKHHYAVSKTGHGEASILLISVSPNEDNSHKSWGFMEKRISVYSNYTNVFMC